MVRFVILLSLLLAVSFAIVANAGERSMSWRRHAEVKTCTGILTSNSVCIGSESNIDPRPLYGRTIIVP
jgi:hypothetical protein